MRKSLIAIALLSSFPLAQSAMAAEAASPHSFTGNFTLASEYIYRGIAQTNRKPAVQGGFDYNYKGGLYLGTWASNISWLSDGGAGAVSSSIEMDFYGGYKFNAGPVGLDFGVLQYYYPGSYPTGFTSPDTTEVYGAATWKWFTFKYSHSLTNLFGAKSPAGEKTTGSQYYDLTGTFDVGGGFNLTAHVGRQNVKNFGAASYTDWKLGVTKDYLNVTWGLAYIGTNAKGDAGDFYRNVYNKDLGKDALLLTIGKTF